MPFLGYWSKQENLLKLNESAEDQEFIENRIANDTN